MTKAVRKQDQQVDTVKSANGRVIHKDNAIIRRTSYGSIVEERLFNTLLLLAKSSLKDAPDTEDFTSAFHVIKSYVCLTHNNYDFLRKLLIKIQQNAIEFDIFDEKKRKTWGRIPLLAGVTFRDDGVLTYSFNKQILSILKNPESTTLINYDILIRLTKRYSIPLYENFKASLSVGYIELTIEQLRSILNIPSGQYELLAELKRNVLTPSLNEINKETDISVTSIPIKAAGRGGKVQGFKFVLGEKPNYDNVPSFDVLTRVAPLYDKLPTIVKDSSSVIGLICKYFSTNGEDYVSSNIDWFLNRISDKMIKKNGPVINMVGLFNSTLEKDFGRDYRIKDQVDRLLHTQKHEDIEKAEIAKLLAPPSPDDTEDARHALEVQMYRDYFMSLPDSDKREIRMSIKDMRQTSDDFNYSAPMPHATMHYLKTVKGIDLGAPDVQGVLF